jgi:hypothetical protein
MQAPFTSHVSAPLHALPSEQLAPSFGVCVMTPVVGSHEGVVHGLPSS